MPAYYNEHDPYAAQWLRNLIAAGHIAPGEVDERSIVDVRGSELAGFTQCHFFAGIGVWSHALRSAGWPDDREVWTGSCPCQPFSAAGKGEGYADERHLWPHWHRLISECRPAVVFGEQVSAAVRTGWLDDVCLSLEELGYAVGAADFPACSVGAPHIRSRIYFVAQSGGARIRDRGCGADAQAPGGSEGEGHQRQRFRDDAGDDGGGGCAVADSSNGNGRSGERRAQAGAWPHRERRRRPAGGGSSRNLGDPDHARSQGRRLPEVAPGGGAGGQCAPREAGDVGTAAANGFWANAQWLACTDGKARPVEPGTFPLAHGAAARVGRLRAYGNAIVAPQAEEFIRACLDVMPLSACRYCRAPIRWMKLNGVFQPPMNEDGSQHRCKPQSAVNEIAGPLIVGANYVPSCECATPPWEECACSFRVAA